MKKFPAEHAAIDQATMSGSILTRLLKKAIVVCFIGVLSMQAQDLITLWPNGKMPNSRGLHLSDSITNERIFRVGTPRLRAFFPSSQENKGSAVIICPGGGYERLAYIVSGLQLAKWFNTMGIAAFVLDYRLPNSPDLLQREIGPLQDAQRSVRIVRSHAGVWGINARKIGVLGVSAGGHLATTLGTHTENVSVCGDSLDAVPFAPDFMILISPVVTMGEFTHRGSRKNLLGEHPTEEMITKYSNETQVTSTTPPTFVVHAYNDPAVPLQNTLRFYEALVTKKVPASLHVFPQGVHNIALRNNPGSTELWTVLCEEWMKEMGFMTPVADKH
jgi:acetyl esterase/lipase